MPSTWIVEAIDVFEDRHLGLPPGCPRPSPDQLGLDAFEERFNGRIVITITFAAHGDFEAMLAEDLLVVMRTVLAAPIAVEDAAFGWHSEGDGHLQRTDRQVTLHAIADGPTDHAP